MYSQIDKMYQQTWESYVNDVMPLIQQFGQISETYDAKFKDIDEQLNVQLESTFTDMGKWWNDNFKTEEHYISLAAKLDSKKTTYDYSMYAGVAGSALIAMFCLGLYFSRNNKTEEKTPKMELIAEALVTSEN